jgi:dienelactone hydrolase
MRHIGDLRNNRTALVRRVQSAIEILSSRRRSTAASPRSAIASVALIVLEYARSGSTISGVVSVHGSLETTSPAEPSSIRARILVCHGALDPHVPMSQVTAFAEEMKHAGADYQLIVYGNAMHGFTHETATGQQPACCITRRPTRGRRSRFRRLFGSCLTSVEPRASVRSKKRA